MKNNQNLLSSEPYRKLLLKLSLPAVVIMLVTVVYNMADTFFIGKLNDPNKITALSLCGPMFSILSGLGTLFGSGGCTAVSLALGRDDQKQVKAITSLSFAGAISIGLIYMSVVLCFIEPICALLGADADTMTDAMRYLRIVALGAPFIMVSNTFNNIIRADGSTIVSLTCNMVGTVSNILLDALFILVFRWDVMGVALATVIGNALSTAMIVGYVLKRQPAFSLNPKDIQFKAEIVIPVVSLGIPMASSALLMSVSGVLANRLMVSHGNIWLAAQGVAGKAGMLITMLIMGICMGLQPAISYCYSAGNNKRLYEILKKTTIFTAALGTGIGILCFFAKDIIISSFIDNPEVIACGRVMVFASLLIAPVYGLYMVCHTFLQATGKASYATIVALLDKGLVYVPVLYLMNHFFHAYGIAYSSAVTLIMSLVVSLFLSLRWNKHGVLNR